MIGERGAERSERKKEYTGHAVPIKQQGSRDSTRGMGGMLY